MIPIYVYTYIAQAEILFGFLHGLVYVCRVNLKDNVEFVFIYLFPRVCVVPCFIGMQTLGEMNYYIFIRAICRVSFHMVLHDEKKKILDVIEYFHCSISVSRWAEENAFKSEWILRRFN